MLTLTHTYTHVVSLVHADAGTRSLTTHTRVPSHCVAHSGRRRPDSTLCGPGPFGTAPAETAPPHPESGVTPGVRDRRAPVGPDLVGAEVRRSGHGTTGPRGTGFVNQDPNLGPSEGRNGAPEPTEEGVSSSKDRSLCPTDTGTFPGHVLHLQQWERKGGADRDGSQSLLLARRTKSGSERTESLRDYVLREVRSGRGWSDAGRTGGRCSERT